jgi:dihydrolipoamide dehydrogenase
MEHYGAVVIGAGSGGLTVAVGLANLGRRVALIEKHYVGGDCTNVGCIPSKTLIHEASHRARNGHDERDGAAILAHVQHKRDHLRDEETQAFSKVANLDLIFGRATILGPQRVAVTSNDGSSHTLEADQIVIATGSRPRVAAIPGLPAERALTNETLFEQQVPPRHLAILGAGVIAMEMASAFRKLGSEVTLLVRGKGLLGKYAPEVGHAIAESMAAQGIRIYYGAQAQRYDADSSTLHITTREGPLALHGIDRVLFAVGRERNLQGLGLDAAGVAFNEHKGIAVDAWGRSNVPNVWAVGDVTPTSHYTHSANAQGRRVVQRIAFPWLPALGNEPLYPHAIFSDPEVASVGLSPAQVERRYHPAAVMKLHVELKDTDRGYTEGLQHGFIQVYAVRLTGRILGATIVGPRAAEMISFWTLAMSQGITLYKLYRLVYPYPTHSSGIQKVADAFVRETLPHLPRELRTYLRYRWAKPPQPAHQLHGHAQHPA